jgi:hypothetical protein
VTRCPVAFASALKSGHCRETYVPASPDSMRTTLSVTLITVASSVLAQNLILPDTNSYPHDYPGKPSDDYSPAWQSCMFHFISFIGFTSHSCARL